ncbi:MAG: HEAT repeat domain-containing protein [Mucilaginibacter sp.]
MIRLQSQEIALVSIVVIMLGILCYMLLYMYFKTRHDGKHDKWRIVMDELIHEAVFYDSDDESSPVPSTDRVTKLMGNEHFRARLTDALVSAKKNMAGIASDNLKILYKKLGLEKAALRSLKSRHWHVKAKAIQELTIMEIDEFVAQLYPFTNNKNELVRMEAQSALVQFNGFEGLRFLDIVTYPISDWQQIKLLQQLSQVPPVNISIDAWIKSDNSSVVVFALKLARNYHRFELHDEISPCLDHPDPKVRLEAINFLSEIATDETSDQFISRFLGEEFKHQLAMIHAMQKIASEKDILFLVDLLNDNNNEMKLSAARALAKMGDKGMITLQEHVESAGYPLNEMLTQIKGELAA